jgi:predicted N-acyltransferase
MSLEPRVAHSVAQVGQEAWDRLAGERPFASYRWHRFGETVLSGDLPVYLLVYQNGDPVARATCWVRHDELVPLAPGPGRRLVETLLARWPLLICQAPLAAVSGLILPEPPLHDEALALLARAAREEARRYHASFVPFVYLGPEEAACDGWPRGYGTVELPEPGTCLPIVWPDFSSYLGSRSRSMRKDYRRHCNRAADLGIEVAVAPVVTQADKAMALIRGVEAHHASQPNPWARAALEHAGMVDAIWLTARIDRRLVACGLLLGDRGTWFLALLGLDYGVRYAYFQMLYAALRATIERRARMLIGGTGAYEIKRRLGFQLVDTNYVAFAGRGSLLGGLGRWLGRMEENKVQNPYAA